MKWLQVHFKIFWSDSKVIGKYFESTPGFNRDYISAPLFKSDSTNYTRQNRRQYDRAIVFFHMYININMLVYIYVYIYTFNAQALHILAVLNVQTFTWWDRW